MSDATSTWLREMERELRRGRHVILHGSVRDEALVAGTLMEVRRALDHCLEKTGYRIRAYHNVVDGIELRGTPEMVRAGDSRLRGNQAPGVGAGPHILAPDVGDALAAARRLLGGSGDPASFVFDFADKLAGPGEHQDSEERSHLVHLSLISAGATTIEYGEMEGMRNALILVAPAIGQIPAWVYRDNPAFVVVDVRPPDRGERLTYFETFASDFHEPGAESTARESFADLTEGMTFSDLRAIQLTSKHDKIGLGDVAHLVDVFKHGRREDPWEALSFEEISNRMKALRDRVVGQEKAVLAVERVLVSARGGITLEGSSRGAKRPKGVLFFVGPTGVGKTELAKEFSKVVFSDAEVSRFDMSEYKQEHSVQRLIGAPPSYVGFEQGGELTNSVRRRPFAVLLFDEIDKAHPRVLDVFLQILDEGRLTDSRGETAYFSQAVLVFTSNLGVTRKDPTTGNEIAQDFQEMSETEVEAHFRNSVRQHFTSIGRPEILGRIGDQNIVPFSFLKPDAIEPIFSKFVAGICASAKERYGVDVTFDASVLTAVTQHCAQHLGLGGRAIRNFVQQHVVTAVNEAVLRRGHAVVQTPQRANRRLVVGFERGVVVVR